ncbi:MAG TPA: hypothetical protein VH394_14330 [Thermoanaerobaculia bacterium]|jgi:hypothetical protein|nr:hypothetical protein [Thermoanaerobaculia bacterium]
MAEARRGLTAEERMRELERDRTLLRRERMLREVAGPRWHRMVRIVPLAFRLQGQLTAHVLRGNAEATVDALRPDAVFALDTAMRLLHGFGFLSVREVHVYLTRSEALERLAKDGLIAPHPFPDTTLVRPWPGPPRLLACLVDELPPWRETAGGYRVVTRERLGRELIGAVGPRTDLYALFESAEGKLT